MPERVDPAARIEAPAGCVRARGNAGRAVVTGGIAGIGAADPSPVAGRRRVFPQITETADRAALRVVAVATQQPEVADTVEPRHRAEPRARLVARHRRPLRAIHAWQIADAGSAHPGPQAGSRVEGPEIVERHRPGAGRA